MDTNKHEFEQSTEYTEETECLADVGHHSEEFVGRRKILSGEELGGLRLLGGSSRFAHEKKNVMRKLEIYSSLVPSGGRHVYKSVYDNIIISRRG